MSSEVASAYVSLIPSYRGGTRRISDQLGAPAEGAGRESGRRFGSGMLGGLSSMKSQIKYVVGGLLIYKGFSAAASFAKDAVFGFNSTLQQANIAFTTMLGSGKKAQTFLDRLKQFAKATPFDFEGLVKNSQLLLGMGISARDVIPDLTALGDSVASVGGSSDTLNNTLLAFGQIAAKGKLSMDNVNQLLQGGIPTALKVLAAQFHTTTGRMVEMISAGKVSASTALPLLVKGLEKGTTATAALGGMMDKQSHTFSGALSNIHDALQQSIAAAFGPFFQATSAGLQSFATYLSGPKFAAASRALTHGLTGGMSALGAGAKRLAPIATKLFRQVLVPAFDTLRAVAPKVASSLRNLWAAVSPLASVLAGAFVGGFKLALALLRKLAPILDSVTGFLKDNRTVVDTLVVAVLAGVAAWKLWTLGVKAWALVTRAATAVQAAFNAVMDANPVMLVVIAIAALAAGMVYAYNKSATFRHIVQAAFNGIVTAGKAVGRFFTKDIPAAFRATLGFLRKWGPVALAVLLPFIGIPLLVKQHFSRIVGWLGGVWSRVIGDIRGFVTDAVGWIKGLPHRLASIGGSMFRAGAHLMGKLWDGLRSMLSNIGGAAATIAKSIANAIIDFINAKLIDPIKNFEFHVSLKWHGIGFSHTFHPFGGLPDIPKLAKGGIVPATPGGRLVRVAEAGQAEAVIPLDKLKGLGGGGGGQTIDLTINEVSDTVGTARAVTRRLAMLGAV